MVQTGKEEGVTNVHLYIPETVYRQLKMIHHDLDFFSMAQLVRFVIAVYLDLHDLYGERLGIELARLFRQWEKEGIVQRRGKFRAVRQLLQFATKMPGNCSIFTLYNKHFAPFWIFRL